MDTAAISKVINLVAETGLFFAQADGNYDVTEKRFIDEFIDQLSKVGPVDEVKDSLEDALNVTFSFDQVVADTRDLLEGFNEDEKAAICNTLAAFVDGVINIDGEVQETEAKYFEDWKAAIGC